MEKSYERAKRYVMWLLSIKNYSRQELLNKLLQKNYSEDIIKKVFKFVDEYKFINEDKIVEKMIENGAKKLQSPVFIKKKLLSKGIDSNKIEEKLRKINESEIAYNLALKKAKKIKSDNKKEIKYKIFKYLSTKGFNYDIIENIINKIFEK